MDTRFAAAGIAWTLGLLAIVGWRLGRLGARAPVSVAVLELGTLLFAGPSWWAWKVRLPESSPVLRRLAALPDVGLVGGRLLNVPVDAGLTTAYPYLGITPPPPNYLLATATRPLPGVLVGEHRWQLRFGVTHGVWGADDDVRGFRLVDVIADPALDRVLASVPRQHGHGPWKLVQDPFAFPPAWVANRVVEARSWGELYTSLEMHDYPEQAWFLPEDPRPALPEPIARATRVLDWDSRAATVEHDGSCILILRRTFYPGWFYRVNGGPASRPSAPTAASRRSRSPAPAPNASSCNTGRRAWPAPRRSRWSPSQPCCSWSGGSGSWSEKPGDDHPTSRLASSPHIN